MKEFNRFYMCGWKALGVRGTKKGSSPNCLTVYGWMSLCSLSKFVYCWCFVVQELKFWGFRWLLYKIRAGFDMYFYIACLPSISCSCTPHPKITCEVCLNLFLDLLHKAPVSLSWPCCIYYTKWQASTCWSCGAGSFKNIIVLL